MASNYEEITDMITEEGFKHLREGQVLRFETATLKITKINRHTKRMWAKHITLVDPEQYQNHIGHRVDHSGAAISRWRVPYCIDCGVPVTEKGDETSLLQDHITELEQDQIDTSKTIH